MTFTYPYPRPSVSVDIVLFALDSLDLKVLLIERKLEPFKGSWALPGGFVNVDEPLDAAARRELEEETGLTNVFVEQLFTFGAVDRDPRDRVITVAYYALVQQADHQPQASSDAADAKWYSVKRLPKLAFDHREIFKMAHQRLAAKVRYQPIGFELLPRKFTLRQLQDLYECILGRELDKRNFRKKILGMELLVPLEESHTSAAGRPAQLFRFDKRSYDRRVREGFHFEI